VPPSFDQIIEIISQILRYGIHYCQQCKLRDPRAQEKELEQE